MTPKPLQTALAAAALALAASAPAPALAITDLLPFGLGGGDDKKDAKHVDSFKPGEPEAYKAMIEQRKLGIALARSSEYGILPPSALTAYVQQIMDAVVKASPMPGLKVRTVVTAGQGITAEARPDGIVYVGWEMLKSLKEEDELAAVLSHELAHVLYRHHEADWLNQAQQMAAQAVGLIDQYKGALGKGTGDSTTGILISLGAEVTERIIATNLWTSDQEYEADLMGVDIMVKARYNPLSARAPLKTLGLWQEDLHKARAAEKKAADAAREKTVEDAVNKGKTGEAVTGFFNAIVSAAGEATDTVIKSVGGDTHPSTEERMTRIQDYIDKHYEKATEIDTVGVPWRDKNHPAAVILEKYDQAWRGYDLIEKDPKEAEALLKKAVTGPAGTDTFPRFAFATLRRKGGDGKRYEINLTRALSGEEPGFVIFKALMKRRIAQGRIRDALKLMDEASKRLGDPPHLIPYRIALLVDAKKKAEALAMHAECKLQHKPIAPACDLALKGLREVAAKEGEAKGRGNAAERIMKHKTKKELQKKH